MIFVPTVVMWVISV